MAVPSLNPAVRPALVALMLVPLALACATRSTPVVDEHAHHMAAGGMAGMDHSGMPELAPIPSGALHTAADVHFMQGMIAHHAQAIYMSRLAERNGANSRLVMFAQKIDQSQIAEIALMQDWLRRNGQVAPDTSSYHTISMPGMLTKKQLAQLEAARGREFERLFLEQMVQHHQGALDMVRDLFASPRAAQDVDVNVFANDVKLVQTTEIELMREMLADY